MLSTRRVFFLEVPFPEVASASICEGEGYRRYSRGRGLEAPQASPGKLRRRAIYGILEEQQHHLSTPPRPARATAIWSARAAVCHP